MVLSYERMGDLLEEIAGEFPDAFFQELDGGIQLEEGALRSPAARRDDLYILGQYHRGGVLGRYVVLYYGSFCRVHGGLSPAEMKEKIRQTLRHELTHHVESLAGDRSLEEADAQFLAQYRQRNDRQK